MTEQGRNEVKIDKCYVCANHVGFHATEDSLAIHPDPAKCRRVYRDGIWRWEKPRPLIRIDAAGVTCLECGTLVLPASEIPCAVPTKSPHDGEIEGG